CFILFGYCALTDAYAQNTRIPVVPINQPAQETARDTIRPIQIVEEDLDPRIDLRGQFERLNTGYTTPYRKPDALLRFMQKDKLDMSPEAKRIIEQVFDPAHYVPEHYTFKDTIFVSHLMLPLVFRGIHIPIDSLSQLVAKPEQKDAYERLAPPPAEFYPKYALRQKTKNDLYKYMVKNHLRYFKYSARDLPDDILVKTPIIKDIRDLYTDAPILVKKELPPAEPDTLIRFIPNRRYWTSAFQSSIHFSQLYISPNWHQGGVGNLTINTLNIINYDYKKDKVSLTNLLELKISVNNAPKDTLRNYKLGDNSLKLRSNFGYKAFSKWDYSASVEFHTLLFDNYIENKDQLLASFASPMTISFGVGMKYNLDKKFTDKHKKLKLSLNLDPFSYGFWYSATRNNIDLGRYGFPKIPDPNDPDKKIFDNSYQTFGSNIEGVLNFTMTRNITLYSRFKYNTTYERVIVESENRLQMAINRYLSTNINFYLRYDDGVAKKDDFDSYFQVKEQLTFGLTYKW
ncbi:DUF3078 domain-containing protein, partial [Parabacteroides sp. OttesenSCG-928-J18]|nr:DUF3078 domain-containing protein [Parabacteroides sp. OttesenSCG-928-J18]